MGKPSRAGAGIAGRGKDAERRPSLDHERAAQADGHRIIAGIDEAGRGPWAGPVVAAAVVLDTDAIPDGIADSKALNEAARETVFEAIVRAAEFGIGIASVERIDRDNILRATLWAMSQAVAALPRQPSLALVDGNLSPPVACATQTIVKGDAVCLSIAAASIVAKVTRDRIMRDLDATYPGYGFGRHKGYGTRQHQEAIAAAGLTPEHRRSFKPIREQLALQVKQQAIGVC